MFLRFPTVKIIGYPSNFTVKYLLNSGQILVFTNLFWLPETFQHRTLKGFSFTSFRNEQVTIYCRSRMDNRDSRLSSKAASPLCLSVAFEHWSYVLETSLPKKLLVASHPLERAAILVFFSSSFFSSPLLSSHSVVIISVKYHHSVRFLWSL